MIPLCLRKSSRTRACIGAVHIRHLQYAFFGLLVFTSLTCLYLIFHVHHFPRPTPPPYSLTKRFITINWGDGRRFGNLLFNYASLLGIAKQNNMTAILSPAFPLRQTFQLSMLAGDVNVAFLQDYQEYGRRACAFDVHTKHLPYPYEYKLDGYFQSYLYFENVEKQLHKDLTPVPQLQKIAKNFFVHNVTVRHPDVVVGIHNRRGDMLEPHFSVHGYTVADETYFKNAMDYFMKHHTNVLFIVCTDDMAWSKEHIRGENVIYSEGRSAMEDFVILTMCDHMIMSVGSFGWWASWIVNGTTIYYDNWPRPVSALEYFVDKRQYFKPNWIPMV